MADTNLGIRNHPLGFLHILLGSFMISHDSLHLLVTQISRQALMQIQDKRKIYTQFSCVSYEPTPSLFPGHLYVYVVAGQPEPRDTCSEPR